MLRLRQYKKCDSEKIAKWLKDEDVYFKWGGKLIGDFPLSADMIDNRYRAENGGCEEEDNFYPWAAIDEEDRVVGSFIMRYVNGDKKTIRFGWVVVDDSIRGKGLGRRMLTAGLKYAFEIMDADKVTIGVYENNDIAHNCYEKVGFKDRETVKSDPWNVIEMEIKKEEYLQK